MPTTEAFEEAYKALNTAQKRAVDAVDGPVMVVAGPGTGKTQVLTLRIANILKKTDTPASGILCLTFTNAGVRAMRERLLRLIGSRGSEVYISTFHRFAIQLIEKHYGMLDFEIAPTLLSDTESVALVDEILEKGEWKHIRPRSNAAKYFGDLKSLISLLKRENLSPEDFLAQIEAEAETLKNDPENVSSRGARKGELKKEIENQIESLDRTKEVVRFYKEYEKVKRDRALMDYDDVLAYAVTLARTSEDVQAELRENYLYIHIDEHQDSSGVQNAFIEGIWGDTEQPNIFVVGDDRQLIYGFGGASLEHFTRFRTTFGKAEEITLVENYRSTQVILDAADALLSSSLADGKLKSNHKKAGASSAGSFGEPVDKILIAECDYPRDEIIFAAQDIKKKIASGTVPEEMAILVPKNHQVRSAVQILRDQGIPVAASGTLSFFSLPETQTVRSLLGLLADPYNGVALGNLLLDPVLKIPPLASHAFMRSNLRKLTLDAVVAHSKGVLPTDPIANLGVLLSDWFKVSQSLGLHGLVQKIGEDLFFAEPADHDELIRRVEIIRTFIHLLEGAYERDPHIGIPQFLAYLDRLEQYGHEIPLAVFSGEKGVRVLTLHGSKGLEFNSVYIAHADESSLMKGRRQGFVLPEKVQALIESKNELVARRELYVAITRAKEYCTISYARHSYAGGELLPARILADIPDALIERKNISETESGLLASDPTQYVLGKAPAHLASYAALAEVVASEYAKTNVSVTLLNNFFECPWKWYFRNLLQLPEGKTESLLLGSVVHCGIEYILKHRGSESQKEMEELMKQCLEKEYVTDEAMLKRVLREATDILKDFSKNYLPHILPNADSERSISYRDPKLPHLTCYGKIDMTEREPDGVQVTDFKTGGAKPKRTIEKISEEGRMSSLLRQLAMYSYLIENAEKGTRVRVSKLLFIEADKKDPDAMYATAIMSEEIDLLKRDIADYDQLVSSGAWVDRPCNAESYGKNTDCEYCAKAKRLYCA